MRQAFIVKNPKWEPYPVASDAFKALKEGDVAVLVVRGRCKEKKAPKFIAKAAKLAAVIALLCLFGFAAHAQQNLIGNLPATTFQGTNQNSSGSSGLIAWNIDQVAVFQLTVVGTNATSSGEFIVRFQASDNGTDWVDAHSITNTPAGTTPATSITRSSNSLGARYLRINTITNQCTNYIFVPRFTMSLKES